MRGDVVVHFPKDDLGQIEALFANTSIRTHNIMITSLLVRTKKCHLLAQSFTHVHDLRALYCTCKLLLFLEFCCAATIYYNNSPEPEYQIYGF